MLQYCGSGLDPDSVESLDPDPDSQSGSGFRRAKNDPQKNEKKWLPVLSFIFFGVLGVLF